MKKLTSFGAVALAALIAVLAMVGFQSPAQAYPDATIGLSVDRAVLYGGDSFTATASSDVHCDWTLEWDGQVRQSASGTGGDLTTTYTSDEVRKVTKIPLRATCAYDGTATASDERTAATWERTIVITVLPRVTAVSAPGAGSDLPNTGGPNRLFLAGGLLLVISGATAVTVARRRAEEAELQASRA